MSKILLNYILIKFLKNFLIVVGVFYCFGLILNLFEEIEFFKNLNTNFLLPLLLTSIFVPSMIIKLLPFIIFISSMIYMIQIRNNRDLLTLKIHGFSNLKIFFYSGLNIICSRLVHSFCCNSYYVFNGEILRKNKIYIC